MPRSKWHVKHQHTHTHTYAHLHIYRNICAGYVKTFIVVCRILDRQRKKERKRKRGQRECQIWRASCHMHSLPPTPRRLSWSCQLLQVQLMPAARPALSHFVYPLNNELWAPGLGHVMADNLHRPREKCNFRKEAAKKYNVTKCAMC